MVAAKGNHENMKTCKSSQETPLCSILGREQRHGQSSTRIKQEVLRLQVAVFRSTRLEAMRDKCLEGGLLEEMMLPYLIDEKLPPVKVEESEWKQAVSVRRRDKMLAFVESDRHISPLQGVV